MIDCMIMRETSSNETIIKEGDDADNFYVIYSGVFDILQNIKGKEKVIASFKQEGSFGELALMYNTPRSATVVSKTKGVLYYIDRSMFRTFVLKSAHRKRKCYEKFLSSVPLLSNLTVSLVRYFIEVFSVIPKLVPFLQPIERSKLSDALTEIECADGQKVLAQGEVGKEMYFILDGKIRIVRTTEQVSS